MGGIGQASLVDPGRRVIPGLTCRDNVAVPLRLAGTGRRAAQSVADEWLGRLDVEQIAGRLDRPAACGQHITLDKAIHTADTDGAQ